MKEEENPLLTLNEFSKKFQALEKELSETKVRVTQTEEKNKILEEIINCDDINTKQKLLRRLDQQSLIQKDIFKDNEKKDAEMQVQEKDRKEKKERNVNYNININNIAEEGRGGETKKRTKKGAMQLLCLLDREDINLEVVILQVVTFLSRLIVLCI